MRRSRAWLSWRRPRSRSSLVPRGGRGAVRLTVPPREYGAVRKIIEEKSRAHVVNVEDAILGL